MKTNSRILLFIMTLSVLFYSCNGGGRGCKTDVIYKQYTKLVENRSIARAHFESFLDVYQLQQISIENHADEILDDSNSLALTDEQKKKLLGTIFDFPMDSYEASYFDINLLNDSIITIGYMVNFYKIPGIYLVSYSLKSHQIKDVYDAGALNFMDWIGFKEDYGYYYKLTTKIDYISDGYLVHTLWKEYKAPVSDLKNSYLTYKDSSTTTLSISASGIFIAEYQDTISKGKRFSMAPLTIND